jgi:hypothetical protein
MRSRKRVNDGDVDVGATITQVQSQVARSSLGIGVLGRTSFPLDLKGRRVGGTRSLGQDADQCVVPPKTDGGSSLTTETVKTDRIVLTRRDAVDVTPGSRKPEAHPKSIVKLGVIQGGVRSRRSQQERRGLSSARRGSAKPIGIGRVPGALSAATSGQPDR